MSNEISTAVTVFQPTTPQEVSLAEKSHLQNTSSHDRCLARGQQLLSQVKTEGMSDALYVDLMEYLRITKITITKMNERRKPVTQVLDIIKKVYTTLENEISIDKSGTIPYQIQQLCNNWAAKKHEEEERRKRAEAARIARENAKARYASDVREDYARQFNALINRSINELSDMDRSISLENFAAISAKVQSYPCEIPADWCAGVVSNAYRPAELTPDECRAIQTQVMSEIAGSMKEQFIFEITGTRDDILDRLPSKKKELQRMAQASAEEAARIKAEMEAKERAEAARKEAERLESEKQEAAKAKLSAEKQEMDSLFGPAMLDPSANLPKAQVKKKVVISSVDDIMRIVAFWWAQEGCNKSLDELSKEFRKQITFANTVANAKDNQMFINGLSYEDEVKAKI